MAPSQLLRNNGPFCFDQGCPPPPPPALVPSTLDVAYDYFYSSALPPLPLPDRGVHSFDRPDSSRSLPMAGRYQKKFKQMAGMGMTGEEFDALPVAVRRKVRSDTFCHSSSYWVEVLLSCVTCFLSCSRPPLRLPPPSPFVKEDRGTVHDVSKTTKQFLAKPIANSQKQPPLRRCVSTLRHCLGMDCSNQRSSRVESSSRTATTQAPSPHARWCCKWYLKWYLQVRCPLAPTPLTRLRHRHGHGHGQRQRGNSIDYCIYSAVDY